MYLVVYGILWKHLKGPSDTPGGLRGGFRGKGIQLESSQISGGQTGTFRGRRGWAGEEDSWHRKQKEKSGTKEGDQIPWG